MSNQVEVIYWPGFTGRAEPILMMLADAPSANVTQTFNADTVKSLMGNTTTPDYPVFACPFVRVDGMLLSQTPAIMITLAKKFGFAPSEKNAPHALCALYNACDIFTEAYTNRTTKPDKGASWVQTRLGKWLDVVEGELKVTSAGGPFFFGAEPTHADYVMSSTINSLQYMFGNDAMNAVNARSLLKRMHESVRGRPGVAKYLQTAPPVLYPDVAAQRAWEVIYWPGFSGRAQALEMILYDAQVQHKFTHDAAAVSALAGKTDTGEFPVFACPFLRMPDGTLISQTIAILTTLGKKLGIDAPADKEPYHLVALNNIADWFGEVFKAMNAEDAKDTQTFLNERCIKWLGLIEKTIEFTGAGGPYFFGDKPTPADYMLASSGDAFGHMFGEERVSAIWSRFPRISGISTAIKARPNVQAYYKEYPLPPLASHMKSKN